MRTTTLLVIVLSAVLLASVFMIAPAVAQQGMQVKIAGNPGSTAEAVPGSYIVKFKDSTVKTDARVVREVKEDMNRFGLDVTNIYDSAIKGYAIENLTGSDANTVLANIKSTDRDVETITQNVMTTLDTQLVPSGIHRIDAETNTNTAYRIDNKEQKPDIDIAVVDTGISPHNDLNIFKTVSFTDQPGTIHADLCRRTVSAGHGSQVAGVIGARDNLGGVVGVIPGARLWSVQIFQPTSSTSGQCAAFTSATLEAYDYLVDNAASIEVANLSYGVFMGTTQANIHNAALQSVIAAGVVVVASAGNSASNVEWGPVIGGAFSTVLPCAGTGVICVGAITDLDGLCGGKVFLPAAPTIKDDQDALYSNWSNDGVVDLYAPGTLIGTTISLPGLKNTYMFSTGTSFAAPYVAGAAGITLLNNPSFTPAQVESDLEAKAYARNRNTFPCNANVPTDSTGGVQIFAWYVNRALIPLPDSECVQIGAKPPSVTFSNWCGFYVDPAKMLDVSGYP